MDSITGPGVLRAMESTFKTGRTGLWIVLGVFGYLLALHFIDQKRRALKGLRLPPGPPGKPIIGNATDMPTEYPWETFSRWAKEYGDLVYIKVLGKSMLIVNSTEIANELFERRSSLYSDRFEFPMMNDLMGLDWSLAIMRYGNRWRRHRRLFHAKFHPKAATAYHDVQIRQTRAILRRLYETPQDFNKLLRHLAGAIIMEITYGIKVLPDGDPYVEVAEKVAQSLLDAGIPGAFLVDIFPILKYVPAWMPGAGFRRKARVWRQAATEMLVVPFELVKSAVRAGTAVSSFSQSLLDELSSWPDAPADEEDIIRNTAAIAYLAGADTTVSATNTFIHAMVLHPEVQKKAQAELDSVVGMNRLPVFEDRKNLPYIDALCKEVIRWHPVLPLGIAHSVTQDDVYGDYFIPRGSIVIGNSWNILHDEKVYGPEPEKFNPERFLKPGIRDPTAAFGYGRRICPGRYMAANSVWIAVTSILKVFDISIARDSGGNEIPVGDSITSGFLSYPVPFQCSIIPRSESAKRLVLDHGED